MIKLIVVLFVLQVNQWLVWLAEPDEESDEDEA